MANILYCGYYRQNDGIGLAAQDYVKALAKTKHNISIAPVYGSAINSMYERDVDKLFIELENNKYDKYDIVIQNTQPICYEYINGVKNIGFTYLENFNFDKSYYAKKFNMLDSVICCSDADILRCQSSGVKGPFYKIPIPTDEKKFWAKHKKLDNLPDGFNFYFISEYNDRKNLDALIIAFHREFKHSDNVNLVIKTHKNGMNRNEFTEKLVNHIRALKENMRLYYDESAYMREVIITDRLSPEDINRLHKSCHCFVLPSRGESWSRPAFDAMGFGNTPIVTAGLGTDEFITDETGYRIEASRVPVISKDCPIEMIYNANEDWLEPSIIDLQKKMRYAYSIRGTDEQKIKSLNGWKKAQSYAPHVIGRLIDGFDW